MAATTREDHRIPSGDGGFAAWLYRPEGREGRVPCVVMAHGFSATRHESLGFYAEQFAAAGLAVLVFDYRHFGDSSGEPRQVFRLSRQMDDWRRAIWFAREAPGIDPDQIVLWGFSMSGGFVIDLAAADPRIAAVMALCPFTDGLARVLGTPPLTSAAIIPKAILDQAGRHTTIPVTTEPGGHGAMSLPGEAVGWSKIVPEGSPWRNQITPGVFLTIGTHRPVRRAKKVACPLWVGLGENDISVSAKGVLKSAETAPQGELERYDYDHWGAFWGDGPATVAADQVAFLERCGLTA